MDKVQEVEVEVGPSLSNQLVKVVLGATAGFIATKLVEKGIDTFVANRQNGHS